MSVLAIGAHPDDVDLYAGGLVAALARAGFPVAMIDLTAGEAASRGTPDSTNRPVGSRVSSTRTRCSRAGAP